MNYLVVPRVGIEPTLLSEPDFESGASTNFTTEAKHSPDRAGNASRIIADLTPPGNQGLRRPAWRYLRAAR